MHMAFQRSTSLVVLPMLSLIIGLIVNYFATKYHDWIICCFSYSDFGKDMDINHLKRTLTCKLCLTDIIGIIFVPCGHLGEYGTINMLQNTQPHEKIKSR